MNFSTRAETINYIKDIVQAKFGRNCDVQPFYEDSVDVIKLLTTYQGDVKYFGDVYICGYDQVDNQVLSIVPFGRFQSTMPSTLQYVSLNSIEPVKYSGFFSSLYMPTNYIFDGYRIIILP